MAEHDLIDVYLDELRRHLRRRRDVDDVLAEVEDHLREVVTGHVGSGMDPRTAERHALGQFGSAELVSRAFAATMRGGIAMPTMVTRLAGLAAMIGGIAMIVVFPFAAVSELDVGGATVWFAPVASASALLVLVGLVGLHLRHRAIYGRAGHIGKLFVPIGLVGMVVSILTWFAPGGLVFLLAITVGLALIGADVWSAGVVDRRALALAGTSIPVVLIVGLFGTGRFDWTTFATIIGFAALGTGLAWVGHGLWRERVRVDGTPTAA